MKCQKSNKYMTQEPYLLSWFQDTLPWQKKRKEKKKLYFLLHICTIALFLLETLNGTEEFAA